MVVVVVVVAAAAAAALCVAAVCDGVKVEVGSLNLVPQ